VRAGTIVLQLVNILRYSLCEKGAASGRACPGREQTALQSETERKLSAESQEPAIRAAPESAAGRPSWRPGWFPVTVSLIYALMGALWILVSDRLALELAPDIETFHLLQSYKGWLYIGITALLLFMVLAGAERHIRKERAAREDTLQRLDFALRAAQGGIWERNLGTGEFFISHHIKRLLGIHSEEALSLSAWRERIHPDDRTHARARMRDFYRHREREISLSYRVRREDGHYCWFQIVGRRVGGKRGEPKSGRVIGVMLDVTALRHAEADIERLIHYDALTGLPNRSMFHAELVHALAASSDSAGLLVARCDLDAFGDVNTELGPARAMLRWRSWPLGFAPSPERAASAAASGATSLRWRCRSSRMRRMPFAVLRTG